MAKPVKKLRYWLGEKLRMILHFMVERHHKKKNKLALLVSGAVLYPALRVGVPLITHIDPDGLDSYCKEFFQYTKADK